MSEQKDWAVLLAELCEKDPALKADIVEGIQNHLGEFREHRDALLESFRERSNQDDSWTVTFDRRVAS